MHICLAGSFLAIAYNRTYFMGVRFYSSSQCSGRSFFHFQLNEISARRISLLTGLLIGHMLIFLLFGKKRPCGDKHGGNQRPDDEAIYTDQ
ncbi:Uncharacterised protein [Brucella neotomae]|nr:Uncharacterised protein [Brucella neotomae]SPU71399.1 Uncharacterised protein [Brucella neotomae]SUW61524.1 Uncharacterised protein [Brucella neotomae]